MKVPLLDLTAQYRTIESDVTCRLEEVIASQYFILGPQVAELEKEIASIGHTKHAIGVASGTDALLLPLKALQLEPGDEVITSPFTFFATAGAIHNAGGTPVFGDVDPHTFNVTPAAVEAAWTDRTRAVVPVHLFGQMAPIEDMMTLAGRHGAAVIEDAAQAIGARRQIDGVWRHAGELGLVGAFSFFPSKNLGGWGDGGMIVVQDDALADRLRRLRVRGGAKEYRHEEIGTNSRLDTLQAAILLAKVPHLASWSEARRVHAKHYSERLADLGDVCVPVIDQANEHIFHQYTLRVPRRDELAAFLKERGIGNKVYYPVPLHLQQCFAHLGYERGQLPQAERVASEVLSLPIYPELSEEQVETVASAIREFYT